MANNDINSPAMKKARQEHWAKVWEKQAENFPKNQPFVPFNPIIDSVKNEEYERMKQFEKDRKAGLLI